MTFLGWRAPNAFNLPALPTTKQPLRWWFQIEEPCILAFGVVFPVSEGVVPLHVCNLFCVPKPCAQDWRKVANLTRMNVA
jgi:hypothetical protein